MLLVEIQKNHNQILFTLKKVQIILRDRASSIELDNHKNLKKWNIID